MNKVKFLVFADIHHYPGVFCTDAPERLKKIIARAEAEKVDFMVSLGDFIHHWKLSDLVDQSFASPVPMYHVLGNHDTDGAELEDILKMFRMPDVHYYFERNGFRFIVWDTNFYKSPAGFVHYQYRNYFDFPETREWIPPSEVEFLENAIMSSELPCILLSHASLDRANDKPDDNSIHNRDEIMAIIKRANADRRRVLMAINGHYHRDGLSIIDNVAYFDVNSASFDWCSNPHKFFPPELCSKYELADHQIIFTEPLSAIVTIDEDGKIDIDGCDSDFLHGVRREMTDNELTDGAGRPCTAKILSASFKLY